MLQTLLTHFKEQGCINSICEVFDGDSPQKPNGCFAQAWSVAQLIEAYNLAVS
jgi:glycogen debranching enzyme